MELKIIELRENIRQARGLIVVIDVFRAFSTACYLQNRGVDQYLLTSSLNEAYSLKHQHPDYILMGERDGFKVRDFDLGNSPAEILNYDCFMKSVIHTSSAGTQGIMEALNYSDHVITGSFVNATAIAHYIKNCQPSQVSLIATGVGGVESAIEDVLCAQYLSKLLNNELVCNKNFEIPIYYHYQDLQFQYVQEGRWLSGDMELCLNFNYFSFVLTAKQINKESCYLTKIPLFG